MFNFDPEEFYSNEDELMSRADMWLEQVDAIASLMDMPEMFPTGWQDVIECPEDEFMQISDENAEQLLLSLQ